MKLNAIAALLFLVASPLFANEGELEASRDRLAIRAMVAKSVVAWNEKDAKKFSASWARRGDLLTPDGRYAKGRSNIEKLIAADFTSTFADTQATAKVESIRFVKRDVAVVDIAWKLDGTVRLDDGQTLDSPTFHVASVVVKRQGKWRETNVRAYQLLGTSQITRGREPTSD